MRYANAAIGIDLELSKERPSFIVVENPRLKRYLVDDIWGQSNGLEGSSVISEEGKELLFTKQIETVLNPFSIDFNSRKIKAKLLEEAREVLTEYEYYSFFTVKTDMIDLFDRIIGKLPYPLEYKTQITPEEYLKLGDIHIAIEDMDITERLVFYIKIMRQVCNVKAFIFVDLCDYFERRELLEILKTAVYNDMTLLFIESKECRQLEEKHTTIIDKDRCVIQY